MESFLTKEQISVLKQEHKNCKTRTQADRIKTVLYLNKGMHYKEVAELLLLDDSTLRRYFSVFENEGIYRLLSDDFKGGQPKLTESQQEKLTQQLDKKIYLSAKEIIDFTEKEFGITYTVNGMHSVLHGLGYTYKKPKHVPSKANKEKQEEFIEKYESIKSNKTDQDKIYFMEGCHPQHNSQPAYGWIKKGTEKELKSNTGRKRVNLNGAYNIEDKEAIVREDEMINSQSTIKLFNQLSQRQKTGIIYIICDNARYYKSKIVNEYLETNERIKILFLPPYSPNLNIIERLWKFFKKKITYNKYYEKFAIFKDKCMNFFENLNQYDDELETFMTDNFQLIQS